MKRLFLLFLVLALTSPLALAVEEDTETLDPVVSIFEESEAQAAQPQTVQFLLGAPMTEIPKTNVDDNSEFLYRALVDQLNTNFDISNNLIKWSSAMIAFVALLFAGTSVAQYFSFRSKAEAEIKEFKHLAQHKLEELKRECNIRENTLQAIVDQQQRTLDELKRPVDERTKS
jgi:hypothetical protein